MIKFISSIIVVFFSATVCGQVRDILLEENNAFDKLFEIENSQCKGDENYANLSIEEKREASRCAEIKSHIFREDGMKLWDVFKTDRRRYDWFYKTVMDSWLQLHYWLNIDSGIIKYFARSSMHSTYDIPIDWNKLDEWDGKYSKMKEEYFAHLINTSGKDEIFHQTSTILVKELESFLKLSLNEEYRHHGKINLSKLDELFVTAANYIVNYEDENSNRLSIDEKMWLTAPLLRAMDNDFFSCYQEFGLTAENVKKYIGTLQSNNNRILKQWCIQRSSLLSLRDKPFDLNSTSIDGRQINLKDLRGKVVLVDIWSTSCSSCIARMPAIKKLYEKYKTNGFEVVSICFNYGKELKKIKTIENKIKGGWPILMLGGQGTDIISREKSPAGQLFKKYGFFGVPQLLLLNKQGKLVLLNDILRDGDFEPIVKKLLTDN
jgi:thiol-disulfide isomerase/thioredoxin